MITNNPLMIMRIGNSLQGLHDLINYVDIKNYPVVEIGTFSGESAQIFAQYASCVYTIDPWVEYDEGIQYGYDGKQIIAARQKFFANVMANDHENKIKSLQLTSEQAVNIFANNSIPFLYIDGWHKFAPQDIDLWWNKIALNGHIAGHDYNKERFPELVNGIANRFDGPDAIFQDESWIVKKRYQKIHQHKQIHTDNKQQYTDVCIQTY